MKNKTAIKSFDEVPAIPSKLSVLGTYEGECADATITNENGLDITREVWENVFSSEIYKKAIEHGWYIGFLGHPEDPNCMDFEHACIVMKEGHIDESGKIYGKFELIDTPVGRVVSAFQNAGVIFGISVRGAGDIISNSVDPETFVFRGFDLVTFPAYPDAIPTFTEIAASTDLDKRAKYKSVCEAVKNNLEGINSCESIDIIQAQFAPQSEEFKVLEDRKNAIMGKDVDDQKADTEVNDEEDIDLTKEKLECMTKLYLEQVEANSQLVREAESLRKIVATTKVECERKISSIERIVASQMNDANKAAVSASSELKSKLQEAEECNLKYKQKIDATDREIRHKDSVISQLRSKLAETVNAASEMERRSSNLDERNRKLMKDVKAANALVREYQQAYSQFYSRALGVNLDEIPVTANTSVTELQRMICGSTTLAKSDVFSCTDELDIVESHDDSDIITL